MNDMWFKSSDNLNIRVAFVLMDDNIWGLLLFWLIFWYAVLDVQMRFLDMIWESIEAFLQDGGLFFHLPALFVFVFVFGGLAFLNPDLLLGFEEVSVARHLAFLPPLLVKLRRFVLELFLHSLVVIIVRVQNFWVSVERTNLNLGYFRISKALIHLAFHSLFLLLQQICRVEPVHESPLHLLPMPISERAHSMWQVVLPLPIISHWLIRIVYYSSPLFFSVHVLPHVF